MKIERTKNAGRGIIFGTMLKAYQVFVPFLMRTLLIHYLGLNYAGLNGLFRSILSVLNLAELGVGSAMVFSMYEPIAKDDTTKICALMRLYKIYYRLIGLAVAVFGLSLLPFLKYLIKSDVPAGVNLYVLYLIELGAAVYSYWLFAYRNSLFSAHQRHDVTSIVRIITVTVQYALQITVLVVWKNYYAYILIALGVQILNNFTVAIMSKKFFPKYKPEGELAEEDKKVINQRIRDLFTAKLGGKIVNSADSIVISAFLGLEILAVYQNYYFFISSLIGFITTVHVSCLAGVGNSIITESKEKNFKDLKNYAFIIMWIAGFCTCCLLCMYQPTMIIWQGVEGLLDYKAVICICVYFFVYEANQLLNMYKDAGGMWREDRFRPLITALTNLVLNLLLVNRWGLYGVLLSTVISTLFIGMPWLLHNLFTILFTKAELKPFIAKLLVYTLVSTVVCTICVLISHFFLPGGWIGLLVRGTLCVLLFNVVYLVIFKKTDEFKQVLKILDRMTKGKLRRFVKV